jgi:hypothetical protein
VHPLTTARNEAGSLPSELDFITEKITWIDGSYATPAALRNAWESSTPPEKLRVSPVQPAVTVESERANCVKAGSSSR